MRFLVDVVTVISSLLGAARPLSPPLLGSERGKFCWQMSVRSKRGPEPAFVEKFVVGRAGPAIGYALVSRCTERLEGSEGEVYSQPDGERQHGRSGSCGQQGGEDGGVAHVG